ncbi:MAG: hypothetical protein H6587_11840 [Flavobacteriales bacterium]|nr:hypothetical protein [Flavobacteriales bacterium]MCB9365254.1 hypothetical protein [Flavobacteriales bacterium]
MKKLLSIFLLLLPILIFSQSAKLNFNYSFYGDYNQAKDDYSYNMKIDSVANVSVYINSDNTNIIVTSKKDTIFNHYILSTENDEGMLILITTNLIYEATFMIGEDRNGITMLYHWVDQTDQVRMHYKSKYFWGNY